MTGVEAAGFVLGILPLLISAAEHYEDVFRPFKRYRKFAPELDIYRQLLGAQKTIFRNECRLLLASLTGRQKAGEMLRDSAHPSWNDSALEERMTQQLADSSDACRDIIQIVQAKLQSLEEEAESFGSVIQQSLPIGSVGNKTWRSRVAKKLKFSFAQSQLDKCLAELRELNQDFINLGMQANRLDTQSGSSSNSTILVSVWTGQKPEECKMVQTASTQLYRALESACRVHPQHAAHFRLDPQHLTAPDSVQSSVRFHMAFAHCPGHTSPMLEPVWITVDSVFDEAKIITSPNAEQRRGPKVLTGLSNSLKHGISSPRSSHASKRIKGKSVRFSSPAPSSKSAYLTLNATVTATTTHSNLPGFCVKHDLCKQLNRCDQKTTHSQYIGYFEKSGPCKHLIHFAPPVTATHNSKAALSLAEIISPMPGKAPSNQFLEYERLRLARQLASAVLLFHPTPLLKGSWRSDDVVFFAPSSSIDSLSLPHLKVQFRNPKDLSIPRSKASIEKPAPSDIDGQRYIRNLYLFSLGVILIELAYQAPLNSLRDPSDLTNGQETKHTNFFVADRLSKTMESSLGIRYAKIVRKCLGCDFGEGTTDLNDPGLQAIFYSDIVCELERLERSFTMLQLDS